ncbi:fMet-Leu-Phe receptor [Fasciolopsis buskii]|uniref:fMet-Leu-Phe receptor n=1 Tax=Fasciolopsis buskii TaxID=27845 RepID=A0A8E0S6W0_9TREM|nr:fMet-Leu-Phe receptor [Fasciolopsis buski]
MEDIYNLSVIENTTHPNQSFKGPVIQINVTGTTANNMSSLRPIMLMLIACIGLIGNLLNLIVLRSYHTTQITHGGECTARVNLLGLALADFFVCLTSLPLSYVKRSHESFTFMLLYTIIGPGLVTYFLSVSVWMVLLMSLVRYIAVCRPLTSRAWLTSRHMCHVIILIYAFGILFHIPSFLMYTYDEEHEWSAADPVYCDHPNISNGTQLCKHTTMLVVYERPIWRSETVDVTHHVIHILFTNIAPFIGVVVSNIAVIRACHRSDQCRRVGNFCDYRGTGRSPHSNSSPSHKMMLKTSLPAEPMHCDQYPLRTPNTSLLLTLHSIRNSPSRFSTSATNRVTPLLLAVIVAFLLFTAPFGIVHFVCLRLMRKLGVRVRDDLQARQLYTDLNSTVEWTNVVQLFSCASNFFLYFLVSTIFRRTTKRTFLRMYEHIHHCHRKVCSSFMAVCTSTSDPEIWQSDNRTHSVCHTISPKLANATPSGKCLPKSATPVLSYVPHTKLPEKKQEHDPQRGTANCKFCHTHVGTQPKGPHKGVNDSRQPLDNSVKEPCLSAGPMNHTPVSYCYQCSASTFSGTAFCSEPQCCVVPCSSCACRVCPCALCKPLRSDGTSAQI